MTFSLNESQFTVKEAAEHLKISRAFLYKLSAEKRIKFAKLGTRTIVPGREVLRFMRKIADSAA